MRGLDLGGCARRVAYCRGADPDCEVAIADGAIFAAGEPLLEVAELRLLGPHNADNAMAAAAAALAMGLDRESVARRARGPSPASPTGSSGSPSIGGVLYVNDSKATNVAATAAALRSFEGGVRAILGGSLKGGGFEGLVEPVAERCAACYLIGEAAERLARDLEPAVDARGGGAAAAAISTTAVARRRPTRRPGEVVLLSPACASFDAYRELRGARRALPRPGRADLRALIGQVRARGARIPLSDSALTQPARPANAKRAGAQPIEYSLLLTATLCLLAFGVVMVFSASSTTALLGSSGDSAYYLKRTLMIGAFGLVLMRVLALRGLRILRPITPLLLGGSFLLLLAVLVPGVGVVGQRRQPLDRRRLVPDPALGARQAGAGPLRRPPARRPPADGPQHPNPRPVPGGGRPRLPADGRRARPRHGDRGLPRERRDAGRRRGRRSGT